MISDIIRKDNTYIIFTEIGAFYKSVSVVDKKSFSLRLSLEILLIARFSLLYFTFKCFQCCNVAYPAKEFRP